MAKHQRKAQAKLNARINAARESQDQRKMGRGGGGYVDAKHAPGIHKPGSLKRNAG